MKTEVSVNVLVTVAVTLETRDCVERLEEVMENKDVREDVGVNDALTLVERVNDGDLLEEDVADVDGEKVMEPVCDALPEALRDSKDEVVIDTDAVLLDEATTDRDGVIDAKLVFDELVLDEALIHAIGELVGDRLDTGLNELLTETLGLGDSVAEEEGTEELLTENVSDGVEDPHGDAEYDVDTVGELVPLSDAV